MEVIYAHLVNTKPPKQKSNSGKSNEMNINQWNNNNSNGVSGIRGGMRGGQHNLKQKVYTMIAHPQWTNSENGCHIETIFQQFIHENLNVLRSVIDELSNEGLIYSTVDDDHFKSSGE